MTSGGNNFNDFAENQLTKFRVTKYQSSVTVCNRTPWNPGQDPEKKDCPEKSRTDGHLSHVISHQFI